MLAHYIQAHGPDSQSLLWIPQVIKNYVIICVGSMDDVARSSSLQSMKVVSTAYNETKAGELG